MPKCENNGKPRHVIANMCLGVCSFLKNLFEPSSTEKLPAKKVSTLNKEGIDTAASDREKILSNGWKQGALISKNDEGFKALGFSRESHDLYVLVSHSCDIAAYSYAKEPHVEFMGAEFDPKENKALAHRRNPRKLQILLSDGDYPFITLDINSRVFINRKLLATVSAEASSISQDALNELQMWISARYRRSAFPDEFNSRIDKAKEIIEEDAKKNGDRNIYGLYLDLNTMEELGDEDYEIVVMGVVREELGEVGDSNWNEAEDYLEFVIEQIQNCEGINVKDHEVVADSGITLKEVNNMKLLDFDYLSHRKGTDIPELTL